MEKPVVRRPRWLRNIWKRAAKDLKITQLQAKAILADRERLWRLLKSYRYWFARYADTLQCSFTTFKGEVNYDWAMDFFRDFEAPWTDAERYVLFQIIAHHNDEGFTFGNMADLVECIKIGGVDLLPGLGFESIDQTKLKVMVYAVNASIPFNALNVCVETDRNKTVGDLIHILRFATELPTKELKVYTDRFCEEEAAEDRPLRTFIEAGSDFNVLNLYLDFSIGYIDDPIVLCDYYFKNRTVETTLEDFKQPHMDTEIT
ncbi:unnamed protein product [Schistocephalus solidus]|uniref:FTH domain-containing protein n=1 Tax=Schistocephalus solidus TaxID=70667 RepID=A0A183T4E1_SCHSO|nr:unnamed protein product [Schistocephalus solidus]